MPQQTKTAVVIILVLISSTFISLFVLFISYLIDRYRRSRVRGVAAANGWRFIEKVKRGTLFRRVPAIPNRKLTNVIVRKEFGCTILFFDYPSGRYGASRVVTVSEHLKFPPFTITPRGKLRLSWEPEVAFPHSPRFASALKVHSKYANEVRRVLLPAAADHIAKCGNIWLDAEGNSYFSEIIIAGKMRVASIKLLMDQHAYIHWALLQKR